ncbi:2-amino-4-hydroxy-6-hydroxymethyldihydropteridine diphosphokinase [Thermosulfuriphilus ammonigenes]|uniref:2-amino-4-hydroxy-6-hydroxymethyldihydropteridine pyrophosphokinase n=1 Tax=Thermosulfuriphilus ammonigenes TaxID=1936021 RepID=A0A6G7PVH4_9BACT|nr:2-amino-4-hydroxy-6-hydroxymethyldihydropteridine diphosphokinase [Thermosulfuriphilus ammonigenes]MBA2848209.1 2-amino-4-hydroxy-6-hydroxymethyldihydropteridine diphosphokinase [Thermosulfuriphilus ammonigenes]QIJ71620.1 2-amino-4-hydroxy-6-hydroxymethyldihydropteridine diphosphokinase [Thermosulfuriphilus ammonigenes]
MAKVYIGVGSNLGRRRENCLRAISSLREEGLKISKVSSLYLTEPVGFETKNWFVNLALEAETGLPAPELMKVLLKVEVALGRVRGTGSLEDRPIDLDLLFYEDLIVDTADLVIPHPRAHLRRFVLEPLAEIAPGLRHPSLGKTVAELLAKLSTSEKVEILK